MTKRDNTTMKKLMMMEMYILLKHKVTIYSLTNLDYGDEGDED